MPGPAPEKNDLPDFLASSGLTVVMLGQDLAVRWFSPDAEKNLGLSAASVGRPLKELSLPMNLPNLGALLQQVLEKASPHQQDVQDKQGRWHSLRLRPHRGGAAGIEGVLLVFVDIDTQKRAEADLRSLDEKYRLLVDGAIGTAIMLLDTEGRITNWNIAAQRLLGYTEDEIAGRHLSCLFLEEDVRAGRPARVLQEARVREVEDDDHELVRKDGSRLWASAVMTPLFDDDGQLRGYSKVVRDITARKEFERALIESDRRKDEFLAMLAHELRNPLAPLQSTLEVLRKSRNDPSLAERGHNVMERQVRTLAHMVDDLLDVSRIRLGKIELRRDLLNLSTIVPLAMETLQPQVKAHQNVLKLSLSSIPLYVEGDPVRLEQIVVNLLGNAIKYTATGGQIDVSLLKEGEHAVFTVKDNGIGLSAEMLPRVFELFAQADNSLARQSGGLGIGLSLVRKLVEMHHGTVKADSAGLGKGSTFQVRLPLVPNAQEKMSQKIQQAKALAPLPRVPRRVLVVDDNVDAAEAMAILLNFAGHEVAVAHDGPSGLEKARAMKPEVVLLDIGMPGMSGYEAAKELRKIPGLDKALVVAVTGYGDEDAQRQLQEAGFDGHLVKPATAAAVERVLALLQPG